MPIYHSIQLERSFIGKNYVKKIIYHHHHIDALFRRKTQFFNRDYSPLVNDFNFKRMPCTKIQCMDIALTSCVSAVFLKVE